MHFVTTKRQKELLRYYWKTHEKFTCNGLVRLGLMRSKAQAVCNVVVMALMHQVIRREDQNGEWTFIGTTEDEDEFEGLRQEKRVSHSFLVSGGKWGPAGLNSFERRPDTDTIEAMKKLVEEKKREMRERAAAERAAKEEKERETEKNEEKKDEEK